MNSNAFVLLREEEIEVDCCCINLWLWYLESTWAECIYKGYCFVFFYSNIFQRIRKKSYIICFALTYLCLIDIQFRRRSHFTQNKFIKRLILVCRISVIWTTFSKWTFWDSFWLAHTINIHYYSKWTTGNSFYAWISSC